MTVAPTLQKYLDQTVTYELISHDATMSSSRTAEACHVSGNCLAKGVVLRRDGGYLLAILPASHRIHLPALRMQLGDKIDLASEDDVKKIFELSKGGNVAGCIVSHGRVLRGKVRIQWKGIAPPDLAGLGRTFWEQA